MSDPIFEPACPEIYNLKEIIKNLKLDLQTLEAENLALVIELDELQRDHAAEIRALKARLLSYKNSPLN